MLKRHLIPTKLSPGAKLPVYVKDGDACADLHALTVVKMKRDRPGADPEPEVVIPVGEFIDGYAVIPPRGQRVFGTGVHIEMPEHLTGKIEARSGTSAYEAVTVGGGRIDPNYRGEIRVILHNLGDKPFPVHPGDRIAQLLIHEYVRADFRMTDDELSETVRGISGMGSSGVQG